MLCNLKGAYCQGSILSVNDLTESHADPLTSPSRECKILSSTPLHIPFNFCWYRARERERAEESGTHGLEHVGLNV